MTENFFERSEEITKRFIQNVVFIDDKAFVDDSTKNAFQASEISKVFAEEGKICAIYAPQSVSDIKHYAEILQNADVVILDWYLGLKNDTTDPDADAEDDEPGKHTISLIKTLVRDSDSKKLKLVVIYTGDVNLKGIAENIHKELVKESFSQFTNDENCNVKSSNFNIIVRAKSQDSENQFRHMPELKQMIYSYNKLPCLIFEEFTKMTNGLLSNFALSAMSVIRENTSRILTAFSPNLDPAYLGHRVLLPNASDAKQLLIKVFGDAISELIELSDIQTNDWIDKWLEDRIKSHEKEICGVKIQICAKDLLSLITSPNKSIEQKIKNVKKWGGLSNKKIIENSSHLFCYDDKDLDIEESNVNFAKLTHHKNIFLPRAAPPVLTLGTIVKQEKTKEYYVCIQQKCDSVRLTGDRDFLFLPLTLIKEKEKEKEEDKDKRKFPIVINKDVKLFVTLTTHKIKIITFKPREKETIISAQQKTTAEGDKYLFESKKGDLEWVAELKDMHAQRIVEAYCSELSRVGVDESEWLRRTKEQ